MSEQQEEAQAQETEAPQAEDSSSEAQASEAPAPSPLDRSWEALQRAEARFREEREAFKPHVQRFQQIDELRDKDPLAAVRVAGFDPMAIAALTLGRDREEPSPEQLAEQRFGQVEAELKQLREDNARMAKEREQYQKLQAVQTHIAQGGDDVAIIGAILAENPGYVDHLQALAEERGVKTPEEFRGLLAEEAARQADGYTQAVKKLLTFPKMRSTIEALIKQNGTPEAAPQPTPRPKTLRQQQQAQEPSERRSAPSTMDERRQRARDALRRLPG